MLTLSEQLHKLEPESVLFKNGLAIAYSKLGDTFTSLNNVNEALRFYQQDADISEQLHKLEPTNISFKNDLAVAYEKLGKTHITLGNLDKALIFYLQRVELGEQLYKLESANVSFKNGLAVGYAKLGEFYWQQQDYQDITTAKKYFKKAHQLWIELTTTSPSHVEFKRNLANVEKCLQQLES